MCANSNVMTRWHHVKFLAALLLAASRAYNGPIGDWMSVWIDGSLCVIIFFSNCYSSCSFWWIFMTLGTRDLCAQYAQNRGTDFRNFDFRIFGKFLKFYVWASVSASSSVAVEANKPQYILDVVVICNSCKCTTRSRRVVSQSCLNTKWRFHRGLWNCLCTCFFDSSFFNIHLVYICRYACMPIPRARGE